MKTVTLEEKLTAQVKNIIAIIVSENSVDIKVTMLEMQKEYIDFMLDDIIENIKTK